MQSISKLKEILSAMLKIHEQLLDIMKEKQGLLIEGKVAEMHVIIGKESKYAEFIRVLEEKREEAIRGFMEENRITESSLTMDEVIRLVSDLDQKKLLAEYAGKLRHILQETRLLNLNNQEMIRLALSYIQYSINIIMPKEQSYVYGKKNMARPVKFLDAKV